jgi:hypothetical protein
LLNVWYSNGKRLDHSRLGERMYTNWTERWDTNASHRITTNSITLITVNIEPREESLL